METCHKTVIILIKNNPKLSNCDKKLCKCPEKLSCFILRCMYNERTNPSGLY